MKLTLFKLVMLIALAISCNKSNPKSIPLTQENIVTIDGLFSKDEWHKAKTIELTPNNFLYLLQNNHYLFLGIQSKEKTKRYVDLYVASNSESITNFHASMQLGERYLVGSWNDTIPTWNWGNNKGWTANAVEIENNNVEVPIIERLKSYEGYEFKISKEKVRRRQFKIRLEIKDFVGEASDIIFPVNSDRYSAENWFAIKLN